MKIKTLNPSPFARMMAAIAMGFLMLSVSSSVVAASSAAPSSTPAVVTQSTKGSQQEVILKDGSKMTFAELSKLPDGAEKEAIINGLTRTDKIKYRDYDLQLANQELKIKTQQLINGYYTYIVNAEHGAPVDRKILEDIASTDDNPEDLKKRAIAIVKQLDSRKK